MSDYIGRFAPSPTGELHLGSLYTALASYLDAKACGGHWLLRIENLDPPREQAGAQQSIIASLRQHGFIWDGDIAYQSQHSQAYEAALAQLQQQEQAFACACSRKQLALQGGVHAGRCHLEPGQPAALRLLVGDRKQAFSDRHYGPIEQDLSLSGDFVLKRKDQLYAYQRAVVVDDAASHISHIVRGQDLLDCSGQQIFLQQCLGYSQPSYLHLPLIKSAQGQKLSKQNHAPALDGQAASQNLLLALSFLGQAAPPVAQQQSCQDILAWSVKNWRPSQIPQQEILLA